MVSELLKRSEDFHISALKGPMRNEKQEGKSRKAFFFLLQIEVQKDLHLIPTLGTNAIRFKIFTRHSFHTSKILVPKLFVALFQSQSTSNSG